MDRDDAYLSPNDAFLWVQEADPLLRSTISGLATLDRRPDWERLRARIERAAAVIPELRQHIVEPPTPGTSARWVPTPDLDLDYHLRRVQAPQPHDLDAALELARVSAMAGLDRARPLWEFNLIDGLSGDRAAFHTKLHHVLTDGIGAMQLAAEVFDLERDAPPAALPPPSVDEPAPEGSALIVDAMRHDLGQLLGAGRELVGRLGEQVAGSIRHPVRTATDTIETARSLARMIEPLHETLSPVMIDRRLVWRLAVLDVGVHELKAAAHELGGSLNDGYLTGLTGGLRRYHEHHGAPIDELRFAMPISLRTADDAAGGNHVTLMRFAVPVGLTDPAERFAALRSRVAEVRDERSIPHTQAVAGALNLLPPAVVGSMMKHVDVLASNVPGIDVPIYLGGARVERYYPFGPTLGAAVNATLLSYDGTCCIGLTVDAGAVPDVEVFRDCMIDGFAEVTDLATAGR
ncbi:MAG: wax ester/triacylglycerol synthase domain-containing protein [Actinomycetota bacterium]